MVRVDIPGEDRAFGGDELFVDMIPKTSWFKNVRTAVHSADWQRLRETVYARGGNRCETCNATAPLEAHERFSYVERSGIQKLQRLIGLCAACHEVTHFGLASIKGRTVQALAHLMRVRTWDEATAKAHIREASALWTRRNAVAWKLDLSILVDAGIRVASPEEAARRAKERATSRLGIR